MAAQEEPQPQKYIAPLCPYCDEPLTKLHETSYEIYVFSEKTGRYTCDDGDAEVNCPNCNADLRDFMQDGACNFEMKSREDYGYCEDCKEFFDLWKYGDVESAGHAQHRWRYVTVEELQKCVLDCFKQGCFEER